jgi:hypothetical protein
LRVLGVSIPKAMIASQLNIAEENDGIRVVFKKNKFLSLFVSQSFPLLPTCSESV